MKEGPISMIVTENLKKFKNTYKKNYKYYLLKCESNDLLEKISVKYVSMESARDYWNMIASLKDESLESFIQKYEKYTSNTYFIYKNCNLIGVLLAISGLSDADGIAVVVQGTGSEVNGDLAKGTWLYLSQLEHYYQMEGLPISVDLRCESGEGMVSKFFFVELLRQKCLYIDGKVYLGCKSSVDMRNADFVSKDLNKHIQYATRGDMYLFDKDPLVPLGYCSGTKLSELLMTPVGIDSLINSLREYKVKKFNKNETK